MPAVITDPSLNTGIVSQNQSIFDYPDTPAPSILSFQAVPSQPLPDRIATGTGLISPDLLLLQRLKNFPDDLYDLHFSSALMHFLGAMMGDSGAGQLRKLQTIARLQSAVTGANFYDLDSFYGALFGALRGPDGALPANPATGTTFSPYTDLATADCWDSIYAIDAVFRERIIALAKAITLGGTVHGLTAVAEAISGVPCFGFETWSLIDSQGPQGATVATWSVLQGRYATWNAIGNQTWDQLQGVVLYGGLGINARTEVIIQPRRSYPGNVLGQQQRASDTYGILKVTEVLKPAFTLVTVSTTEPQVQVPVVIRSMWADSEYWEIVPRVTLGNQADPSYASYLNAQQPDGTLPDPSSALAMPSPPFSQFAGTQYSYAADVTAAYSQTTQGFDFSAPITQNDYEVTTFPSGASQAWLPALALMDPVKAASARAASSVSVIAAPYAGPRVPVAPLS